MTTDTPTVIIEEDVVRVTIQELVATGVQLPSDVIDVNGRGGHVIGLAEQSDLDAEVARAEGAEADLAADVAAEASARTAADGAITADLATEATARSSGDAGEAAARAAAIASEATTRAADDSAEATTRAAADTSEASARAAADTSEATARTNADSLLIPKTDRGAANGVAPLDGTGKLPVTVIPSLAIEDVFVVGSEAAMLAAPAQKGDVAKRTDLPAAFILAGSDPTILSNWVELPSGTGDVIDVNGRDGHVTGLAEQTDLDTEVSRAEAAEADLATDLATEISDRTAADASESSARIAADATETAARIAADATKQPLDADLTAIAGLDAATPGAIASDGGGWMKKTYAQLKTALGLVKADVGLGNADDTSDANKPVSTAQAAAIAAEASARASADAALQPLDVDLTAIAGYANRDAAHYLRGDKWAGFAELAGDIGPELGLTSAFPLLASTKVRQTQWLSGLTPGAGTEKAIYCLLSGTATSVTSTSMTDLAAPWPVILMTGLTVTMGGSTLVVTSNSAHVLTGSGGWVGGTPAAGPYTVTVGACPSGFPGAGTINSFTFGMNAGRLNQDLLVKVYTDGNASAPDINCDLGTLFCSHNDMQACTGTQESVSGTVAFSAQSSATVVHGLGFTPQSVEVFAVTPSNVTLQFWAESLGGTTFAIKTLGNFTGTVGWVARGPGLAQGSTEHVGTTASLYGGGIPSKLASYVMRFPIPFSTGILITTSNVNNADAGFATGRCSVQLGVAASYRLKSVGSTWKNGGTERQLISSTATAGTFVLNYAGQTTAALARNASASTIQAALIAIGFPGTCTGGPLGTAAVSLVGALQPVSIVDSTTGGTTTITSGPSPVLAMPGTAYTLASVSGLPSGGVLVYVALCARGVPPYQINMSATGGTFTLTWNGQTTGNIAWNASASTVLAALAALTGWVAGGTVTGGPITTGGGVSIQQNTRAPLPITINTGGLTGGTATCGSTAGSAIAPYTYLERDVSIVVDGESTPSIYAGGVDSFWYGGNYFDAATQYDTPALMVLGANNQNGSVNVAMDLITENGGVPFASGFVWALLTEAAVQAAHEMSYAALYYQAV